MIKDSHAIRYLALGVVLALSGACSSADNASNTVETSEIITADYPGFGSIADAADYADLVVIGRYVSSTPDLLYPSIETEGDPISNPQAGLDPEDIDMEGMAVVVTVSKIQIIETLKGEMAAGETIEVSQVGGKYQGTDYREASTTFIKELESDQVVLFLRSFDGRPFDIINPTQGLFEVNGEQASSRANDPAWTAITTLQQLRSAVTR